MISTNHSIFSIIIAIIIVVGLFLLFSFLNTYLPLFYKKHKGKYLISRYLYLAEIIIGLFIGIGMIGYLYHKNTIVAWTLILFLIMASFFISLYFFKDYIAGLIIKSSGIYNKGDTITTEKESGKIVSLKSTHIKLINNNGESIYIPYSLLMSQTKNIQKETHHIASNITFWIDGSFNENTLSLAQLKIFITQLPWTYHLHEPLLSIEDNRLFVTVYTFDKKYKKQIKNAVIKQIQEK